MTAALIVTFAGYAVASYGAILLRGYDISFRQWMSPLHPWQWPAAGTKVAKAPNSRLFPAGQGA